jgi:hypothetical protein
MTRVAPRSGQRGDGCIVTSDTASVNMYINICRDQEVDLDPPSEPPTKSIARSYACYTPRLGRKQKTAAIMPSSKGEYGRGGGTRAPGRYDLIAHNLEVVRANH